MKRTILGFLSCINPRKDKRDYNSVINEGKDYQIKGTHKDLIHGSEADLIPERIVTTINEAKREGPLIKRENNINQNFDKEQRNDCNYTKVQIQETDNFEVDSPKVMESNDSIIHNKNVNENENENNNNKFNFIGSYSRSRNKIKHYNSERNKATNFSATLYKNFRSCFIERHNKTIKEENDQFFSQKIEKQENIFSNRNNNSTEVMPKSPAEIN